MRFSIGPGLGNEKPGPLVTNNISCYRTIAEPGSYLIMKIIIIIVFLPDTNAG